jgi:hypothetical protein
MKHFTVRELDLDKYRSIMAPIEVSGGSRPRLTLYHKEGNKKYFFKTYSHNPREVWAECLASHIADLLDLRAQEVTIKIAPSRLKQALRKRFPTQLSEDWKPVGTLARNIFPKNVEITYGAVIVETPTKALTLEEIEAKIRSRYYAADDLLQDYSDMIVFDVLIGNMDRHHENWGICEHQKYKQLLLFDRKRTKELRYFAPLFDHGSSLLFELSQENVVNYLQDEGRLHNYIENSKFGFLLDTLGNKANMFTIIEQHIDQRTSWRPRFKKSLARVKQLDLLAVAGLVIQMPSLDILEYDSDRRGLLYKSLLIRYNKLNELYERERV